MDGTHDNAPAPIGYTQPASLCIAGMAEAPSSELGPDAVWMGCFLDSVLKAPDWMTLTALGQSFAEGCGYDRFLLVIDTPRRGNAEGAFILSSYPREWLNLYVKEGYVAFDPVLAHGLAGSLPFDWSEVDFSHPQTQELVYRAQRFGLRAGCSAPARDGREACGLLSLAKGEPEILKGARRAAVLSSALMASHALLARAVRIAEDQRAAYEAISGKLLDRDLQLLRDIGLSGSIEHVPCEGDAGRREIEGQVARIMSRLGARDMEEMMLRATVVGLVDWDARKGAQGEGRQPVRPGEPAMEPLA